MMFSDKLVFLMNLTEINSAALARALEVDPSQISRLRTGVRSAPRKREILRGMAHIFSSKCSGDYQRAALSEMLGRNYLISVGSQEELEDIIFDWLSGANTATAEAERFLQKVGRVGSGVSGQSASPRDVTPVRPDEFIVYYGNSGKRYAISQALNYMLSQDKPCTLMIASDESTDWIAEDKEFSSFYASSIFSLAQRGCKIYRILPPMRTTNDALESVSRWVPAYLTSNVYPYYFPRMRDGIYRRTLVVIPGVAAYVSSSVGWQYESGAIYANSYKPIVDNYEREFRQYMAMCRRAMRVIDTQTRPQDLSECMRVNNSKPADRIFKCDSLSVFSMPDSVADSFSRRIESTSLFNIYHAAICGMLRDSDYAMDRNITDIMTLATPEMLRQGKVPCSVDSSIYYTLDEYRKHLSNIIDMLERYEKYNVVLTDKYKLGCGLAAKEGVSSQIFRTEEPKVVLDIESDQMLLAVWEFLCCAADTGYSTGANKRHTISALKDALLSL